MARDYSNVAIDEMAGDVRAIWRELKARNPLFINAYAGTFIECVMAIEEIAASENWRAQEAAE